jgi:S1-C subfamily serine protease
LVNGCGNQSGNSGGPVIDISGRLVGISSLKMAFTPQGITDPGTWFRYSGGRGDSIAD